MPDKQIVADNNVGRVNNEFISNLSVSNAQKGEIYKFRGTVGGSGLIISEDGKISGKPAHPGHFQISISAVLVKSAADQPVWENATLHQEITINIDSKLEIVAGAFPKFLRIGSPVNIKFEVKESQAAYDWTIDEGEGSVPTGLVLDKKSGILKGVPGGIVHELGDSFTIKVLAKSNQKNMSAEASFRILVYPALVATVRDESHAIVGQKNNRIATVAVENIGHEGGSPTYDFVKQEPSGTYTVLPDIFGLTIDHKSGVISGEPKAGLVGRHKVLCRVSDGSGYIGIAKWEAHGYSMQTLIPTQLSASHAAFIGEHFSFPFGVKYGVGLPPANLKVTVLCNDPRVDVEFRQTFNFVPKVGTPNEGLIVGIAPQLPNGYGVVRLHIHAVDTDTNATKDVDIDMSVSRRVSIHESAQDVLHAAHVNGAIFSWDLRRDAEGWPFDKAEIVSAPDVAGAVSIERKFFLTFKPAVGDLNSIRHITYKLKNNQSEAKGVISISVYDSELLAKGLSKQISEVDTGKDFTVEMAAESPADTVISRVLLSLPDGISGAVRNLPSNKPIFTGRINQGEHGRHFKVDYALIAAESEQPSSVAALDITVVKPGTP
ncbi:TPA: hypothetical protein ACUNF5_007280 [Burkholderia orbicola]|uniref:hypothetical protein n=1 Tax=Burkholderia orbicola TaxID=2978683 RepID=UPI00264AFA5F|nr:hypothetical protein [Burkholderia orbicola]MDN7535614.1 hypothetical protein [Burkholderia orbicola]